MASTTPEGATIGVRTPRLVFFYPQLKKLTGAQRLIVMLARYATRAGARVTIVTHRIAPEVCAAIDDGIAVVETGVRVDRCGNHYADAALEYLLGPLLLRAIPRGVDAVVFFGPPSLPALWAAGGRLNGAMRLYFCYEPPRAAYSDRRLVAARAGPLSPLVNLLAWAYRPVDRHFARAADAICANGQYGRELIRRAYGVDATILPHGVDVQLTSALDVTAIRERWRLPPGAPLVLTVNQLHPRKRIELLLRAAALLRAAGVSFHVLVVGEGAARGGLEALRRELALEDTVTLCGFVPDDELAAYYAAATVYAHTALAESLGLSVLEAAANGVPVVAVAEGGPLEILAHERTGLLVEAVPAAIASALGRLLSDPSRAREMGARARDDVQARYRWEDGAARLLQLVAAEARS